MPTNENDAPTGKTVAANIARQRQEQRLSYAELSRKLTELGRPIPTLGLRKIESHERRVDVDDLLALAVALDTTPTQLLLPTASDRSTRVAVTGFPHGMEAGEFQSWLTLALYPDANESLVDRIAPEVMRQVGAALLRLGGRDSGTAGFKFESGADGDD